MTLLLFFYLFLLSSTFLIFKKAYDIWKRTKDFTLPICVFFIYYFSLGGALIFPLDYYSGFKGVAIGLHYLPIFDRLFPVSFDFDYFLACTYYVLFILVFEYVYIFFIERIMVGKHSVSLDKKHTQHFILNPVTVLL